MWQFRYRCPRHGSLMAPWGIGWECLRSQPGNPGEQCIYIRDHTGKLHERPPIEPPDIIEEIAS